VGLRIREPGYARPVEWTDWRQDVFGDPYLVWHEGTDLEQLTHRPLDEVTRMLQLGLRAGDHVAAQAYGHLSGLGRAPEDPETLLRSVVATAEGAFLVAVAQALHVVTGDEEWAKPVVAVLGSNEEHVSYKAAIALNDFESTPYVVEALRAAVRTGEYLTRYHAEALLRARDLA
jgi:hypothetical protein